MKNRYLKSRTKGVRISLNAELETRCSGFLAEFDKEFQ